MSTAQDSFTCSCSTAAAEKPRDAPSPLDIFCSDIVIGFVRQGHVRTKYLTLKAEDRKKDVTLKPRTKPKTEFLS